MSAPSTASSVEVLKQHDNRVVCCKSDAAAAVLAEDRSRIGDNSERIASRGLLANVSVPRTLLNAQHGKVHSLTINKLPRLIRRWSVVEQF